MFPPSWGLGGLMRDGGEWMQAALNAAYETVKAGAGGPFGACIVREGALLAVSGNHVLDRHDPTAHAEVCAIRVP